MTHHPSLHNLFVHIVIVVNSGFPVRIILRQLHIIQAPCLCFRDLQLRDEIAVTVP